MYSYVENFGRILSCEESCKGLDIRMIEVDHFVNCYHHIDGQRVLMRWETHILDLPLFCLKEICKWLLETSIDDLCSVTEVCTTLKDAATLAFDGKFSKSGTRITLKNQMQTDVRLLQCFRHLITRLEINAEDREHFIYILSSLKKMSPNVLKYLIFSNKRPNVKKDSNEYCNHFSHISKAELEELLPVFSHLEGISFNTNKLMFPRLPPNLRIFNINFLSPEERFLETSATINTNLQKIIIDCPFVYTLYENLWQSSQQIKEITLDGWDWKWVQSVYTNEDVNEINDMVRFAPQLEVLSMYTGRHGSSPNIANIQTLKKMRNLKILNLSLTNPSMELLNAINELNVTVECLSIFFARLTYEISLCVCKFNHLKFLRIETLIPLEELAELLGCLPQLSVLVLKKHLITLDHIKRIISACSKLTDFHVGSLIELEKKLDTKQYLEIVTAARSRPNELQLRIWLTKYFTTNIDSKVFCDNVKYVNVLLRLFKFKSYPPCGFTV